MAWRDTPVTGLWQSENVAQVLKGWRIRELPLIPEIPYSQSAYIFLLGVCSVFASALHREFGYQIAYVTNEVRFGVEEAYDALCHAYCRVRSEGRDYYIDIRGSQPDRTLFLKEFSDTLRFGEKQLDIPPELCEQQDRDWMRDALYEQYLHAAEEIIRTHQAWYTI